MVTGDRGQAHHGQGHCGIKVPRTLVRLGTSRPSQPVVRTLEEESMDIKISIETAPQRMPAHRLARLLARLILESGLNSPGASCEEVGFLHKKEKDPSTQEMQ